MSFRFLPIEDVLLTSHQKLVAFFDAIDTVVKIAVETQVDPFLVQIAATTAAPLYLGGYTVAECMSTVCTTRLCHPPISIADLDPS